MPIPPADSAAAMRRLAVDAITGLVVHEFAREGIAAVLLKGLALQRRLYGDRTLRPYGDTDLLVAPSELARAGRALERLGFTLGFDPLMHPLRMPGAHAQEWRRGRDAVDLHWRLPGAEGDGEATWRALAAHRCPIAVGEQPAITLDDARTALLLALDAAHHGEPAGKPLRDLALGLESIAVAHWVEAAMLAAEIGARDAFAAGLRLVAVGEGRAAELRLPAARSATVRLKAGTPPPSGLAVLHLLETPWRAGRARAIRDAIAPSPAFMRAWFPRAREGRRALAFAYCTRLVARSRQLPAAVAAARRARRRSA